MGKLRVGDAHRLIAERKPFQISHISAISYYATEDDPHLWRDEKGVQHTGGAWDLPDRGWGDVEGLRPEIGVRYVVLSYATPIAWVDKDGVAVKTPQHFSITTSHHQGELRKLEDDPGGSARAKTQARRRYEKAIAAYHQRLKEERAEARRAAAAWRAERKRAQRAEERARRQEVNEALASIVYGPADKPVLLGIEGEREAIDSILAPHAIPRHATKKPINTRA